MPMTRQQMRQQAAIARYKAGKQKPPTRAQAQAWLAPIRKAFAEIKTGERRVIEFLLSPIVRTASESLRER